MTTQALSGIVNKVGRSQKNYAFGFGWSCRYNLEGIYGPGLLKATQEVDEANWIANVLMCGLKTQPGNLLPEDFGKKEMYALLDDLSENDVKEVWEVAKQSLGFIHRIMGYSEEDVKRMAEAALKSQSLSTGTPS